MFKIPWFGQLVSFGAVVFALTLGTSSAHAALLFYRTNMSGPAEAPPNASPGTGTVNVTVDTTANTMRIQVSFTGLTGTTSAAHIHAATPTPLTGTAGVATQSTLIGFPTGVSSGSFDGTLNMLDTASYNGAFVTANGGTAAGAQSALISALNNGQAYFNVHSSTFAGGEIRGFLVPVPEPSSMALAGTFALGALGRAWRKRRAGNKPAEGEAPVLA